jgi:hypothetical protein
MTQGPKRPVSAAVFATAVHSVAVVLPISVLAIAVTMVQ